jgi:NitT/TauT family transport system substrate-binding protein
MAEEPRAGLTIVGKLFSFLLVLALIGLGVYIFMKKQGATNSSPTSTTATNTTPAPPVVKELKGEEISELKTSVNRLAPAAPNQPKENTLLVEISEYAGYAGLVAANGGLEPNDNSIFSKKYGFKVKLVVSEEESWDKLNSGQMAASVTTADVLAAYGKQFQVVVPAQIGFSRGADGIVVRSDVKRINGLKGKMVAATQFTESDFFVRYLAQEAGLGIEML